MGSIGPPFHLENPDSAKASSQPRPWKSAFAQTRKPALASACLPL